MSGHGFVCLPERWTREDGRGFGPFVTREVVRRADGVAVVWESRRWRKRTRQRGVSTWWAPSDIGWWIGVLFAIGSTFFALGAFPPYADAVGANADNLTYFIGSLFFTTAAFCLFWQVVATDRGPSVPTQSTLRRLVVPEPSRIDWWAALIQLAGTLFFNATTAHALFGSFGTVSAANQAVWRPDALGSICFLVSSWLSWAEVCDGWWAWRPREISWWIPALNLLGSIAFGVSAIASKVEPDGDVRSLALTNLGTFVGAVCFLVGGLLLLPERTEGSDAPDLTEPAPAPSGQGRPAP
ncbi:MAG TPA: hypothetical protein VKG43_08935 [Acidimicrobiales bacterium]|nr:hypothetical protein [Acidimicrobiales bacterium]